MYKENMYKDYGILVIKPDGIEKGFELLCENEIHVRKLNIIAKKKMLLCENDIYNYFYYQFNEYVQYMCSNEVCAYLIEGLDRELDAEVFHIKNKLRLDYGVNGTNMRNYIHGAHCGTEFFLQRKLFFPEYILPQFSSFADMLVCPDSIDENFYKKMNYLINNSNVKKWNINIPFEKFNQLREEICKRLIVDDLTFSFSTSIRILDYLCDIYFYVPKNFELSNSLEYYLFNDSNIIKAIGDIEGVSYSTMTDSKINSLKKYNAWCENNISSVLSKVLNNLSGQNINIKAMLVNTSQMSLREAEIRYELSREKGLSFVGGSGSWFNTGLFGISESKYNEISNELLISE